MSDKPVTDTLCARCELPFLADEDQDWADDGLVYHGCFELCITRLRAARLADAGVIEGLRGELADAVVEMGRQAEEAGQVAVELYNAQADRDTALARVAELTNAIEQRDAIHDQLRDEIMENDVRAQAAKRRVAELTGELDAANQHCKILGEFRDAAERRAAEAHKDAERYRWLQENMNWSSNLNERTFYLRVKNYVTLHDFVDAAIASRQSGEKESNDEP